jgi:membrane associated rhomboid family serine protease
MRAVMAATIILAVTVGLSLIGFARPVLIERALFRPYWFLPKRQYWTVISNGFVHANLAHLIFNVLSYWFFAFPLQRVIGPARFVTLYLLGLIASNVGTYFQHRRDPAYASLGASGAILAVLFAAIVYFPRSSIMLLPLPLPLPAPLFALLFLAFSYYSARHPRGQINYQAHFDGALAGLAFVAITDWPAWVRAWHAVLH